MSNCRAGLKPLTFIGPSGAAEAAPFQNSSDQNIVRK